jgi:hypothetical protein
LVEVVHHENRVESRRFGLASLRDDGWKELFDAGAVRKVGNLKAKSDSHATYPNNRPPTAEVPT